MNDSVPDFRDAPDVDAEAELLEYLAAIRAAVVGRVADRPGIEALRETVGRLFERFTLYELRDAPDDDAGRSR